MQLEEITPLTKEVVQKLMETKGECRGMGIKSDWEVILQTKGKEGLEKIEAKMAELGYPLKYEEIKTMDFYPIGYAAVFLLAIKEVFNFDKKDFEELGAAAVKYSLFIKIFLQYFVSIRLIVEQTPAMWRKHYTIGEIEILEFNEREKYVVGKLKNIALHPFFCAGVMGYFTEVMRMVTQSSVTCQETKCIFQGDEYHEFLLKW